MKRADDNFGDMLAACPFDDSIREEHRREVRERAMRAFDESAAAETATIRERSPRRLAPRHALRAGLAMAVAASLAWAIFVWRQPAGPPVAPGDAAQQLADAQLKQQRKAANDQLVAALNVLSAFDEERAALTFAQGVDICVRERDGRLAGEGS